MIYLIYPLHGTFIDKSVSFYTHFLITVWVGIDITGFLTRWPLRISALGDMLPELGATAEE